MKIIGLTLAVLLLSVIFTNNVHAEGGNQIWITKTKRGIDISCPSGFQYTEEASVYSCTKEKDALFTAVLEYDDLYVEEEFFNEKDILKQAIIFTKSISDGKIVEKKTSSWFGKITADVKYKTNNLTGLVRIMVFNDGTTIMMNYASKNNGYDVADKTLSTRIKLLEPNQVREIEKKLEEYTRQAKELASKKEAEEYKKKLEQEQKAIEDKKKAEELKKKIEKQNRTPIGKDKVQKTIDKLKKKIQFWEYNLEQLKKRYQLVSLDDRIGIGKSFAYVEKSISALEIQIDKINEHSTPYHIETMMKNGEVRIKSNYDFVLGEIKKLEDEIKEKQRK